MQTYQSIDNMDNNPASIVQQSKPKKQIRATTTWHLKSRPSNLADFVSRHDLGPLSMYEPQPEDVDRGPVPYHPVWRENLFLLRWLLVPLTAQGALLHFTEVKIEGWKAVGIQFALYQFWFILFAINVLHRAQYYMQHYGTLNEHKRGRDLVPDSHHTRVSHALIIFTFVRSIGTFALGKDSGQMPYLDLWTPLRLGAFHIALDYFFYIYHRSTHEIDALWFIHRQHHATKSPTPQMSLWADDIQDSIEWAIVPFLAYQVMNLSFAELWLVSGYTLDVEAMGHSGIRAYWPHPLLFVLKPFGMELAIEDHDLHHRYGRGGKNYGKQTRVWDVLFGTVAPREEEQIYAASLEKKNAKL